jgi:CBS domain-containing protein
LPKWKCYRCGAVFEQENPPDHCSSCNADVSFWIDWTDAKSPLEDPVEKYMSAELITIDINESAWDAARLMKERHVGSVFVTQDGRPVGVVTERDMLYKIVADDLPAAHVLLRKIMSSPLVSVTHDTPAKRAFSIMNEKNFRRLLVTKDNEAVGVVTLDDLARRALLREEELLA